MSPEKRAIPSSMEPCPACDTPVLIPPGDNTVLRCDACGMRFTPPRAKRDGAAWNARDDDGLGIHPALAKRYKPLVRDEAEAAEPGGMSTPPSVQTSPGLVGDSEEDEGSRTEPGKVAREQNNTSVEMPKTGSEGLHRGSQKPVSPSSLGAVAHDDDSDGINATPVERRKKERPSPMEGGFPALPGFEIVAMVGQGAMGRVFKAKERSSGRVAALKLLSPELAARADFVARFEREAAAMERVQHPGVVRIVGNSSHGNLHYLWMHFVEGGSLRRILDQGRLTPARALNFARQIIQGLGAAHDVDVIHRDLKPENILVAPGDETVGPERLVLVDFGLAGITDENEDPHPNLTKSRMTMGTVNYMAPEQRTNAKHVDARADLYATGVILYELLMGDLPLGRFALPTERGLALPPAIDDVVVKALARAPEERYQSAAEFDRALAEIETAVGFTADLDTLVGDKRDDGANTTKPGDVTPAPEPARAVPESAPSLAAQRSHGGAPSHPASSIGIKVMPVDSKDSTTDGAKPFDGEMHLLPASKPGELAKEEAGSWASATGSFNQIPWYRRVEIVGGFLALAIGAAAGILLGPGTSEEKFQIRAPGPEMVTEDDGLISVRLSTRGPEAAWRARSGGFAWAETEFVYAPPEDHVGPAFLRPESVVEGESVEVQALVKLPSEDFGKDGWGGILFSDESTFSGVGAAIRSDGSCAVLIVTEGRTRAERVPCKLRGPSANLALRCKAGRCRLTFDGTTTPGVYTVSEPLTSMLLGCAGTTCRFGPPQ